MSLTYFGNQTHNSDDGGNDVLELRTLFTCTQSGAIGELSARAFVTTGSPKMRLAVYNAAGTVKICEGVTYVLVTGGSPGNWFGHLSQAELTPNPVSLVNGTQYLLVLSGSGTGGNILGLRYDSADTPDSLYTLDDYSESGFPSSLPGGASSSGECIAIRCGIIDSGGAAPTPSVSDSTAATDAVKLDLIVSPNKSEATTVSESLTMNLLLFPTRNDATAVTDSLLLDLLLQPIVSDASTGTDTCTVLLPTLNLTVLDATTISEIRTVLWALPPFVNDGVTLVDSVTVQLLPVLLTVTDTTTVTDALQMAMPQGSLFCTVSDTLAAFDIGTPAVPLNFSVQETILLTEGIIMNPALPPLHVSAFESLSAVAGKLSSLTTID